MWRGCSKSWGRGGGPRRCARRGSWGWCREGASFGAKSAESPVLTIAGRRDAGPNDASSTARGRSEEHTSELQSLMRISYAVFCLKKKTNATPHKQHNQHTTTKLQTT